MTIQSDVLWLVTSFGKSFTGAAEVAFHLPYRALSGNKGYPADGKYGGSGKVNVSMSLLSSGLAARQTRL